MSYLAPLTIRGQITANGYAFSPVTLDAVISPTHDEVFDLTVFDPTIFGSTGGYDQVPVIVGSVDTSVLGVFVPRIEGGVQVVGSVRVKIDGYFRSDFLLDSFSLTETDEGAVTFQFGFPYYSSIETDQDDFGNDTVWEDPLRPSGATTGAMTHYKGPAPGGKSIIVDALVPAATGSIYVPLVTDGITENSEIVFNEEGATVVVNGTGPTQRLDRKNITIEIPVGHGMTMGEMVTWIMEETRDQNEDDWDYTLPTIPKFFVVDENGTLDTRQRFNLIQAVDRPGIETAQELLEVVGHKLTIDRKGDWKLNRLFADTNEPIDWSLTTQDIIAESGVVLQPNADGPPVVVFSGSSQDTIDDPDGLRTTTQLVEISGPHTVIRPEYHLYGSTEELVATGYSDRSVDDIYYRETTLNTYAGEALVSKQTTLESVNTLVEYTYATQENDGSPNWYTYSPQLKYFADEGIVAWEWYGPYFRKYQEEIESNIYEEVHSDGKEYLSRKISSKWAWHNPIRAILSGSSYINGVRLLWDGNAALYVRASFVEVERVTTSFEINEEGFIEVEEKLYETAKWLSPGDNYTYADGRTSNNGYETWGTDRIERTTYSASDDAHTKITTITKDGRILETRTETGEGYLPAATMKTTIKPTALSDGTPLPNAQYADPSDGTSFEVTYEDQELLKHRPRWEEHISNAIVADEDEGLIYARRHLRERAAIPVMFAVPWNPLMKPTHWVEIDLGQRGYLKKLTTQNGSYDVGTIKAKVVSCTHTYDREGGAITSVEAKVYPV